MKVNMTRVLSILVCSIFVLAESAYGQISSSYERAFYTDTGASAKSLRYCVKFESNRVWVKAVRYDDVRKNLASSASYYDNEKWEDNGHHNTKAKVYTYCATLSTTQRKVYKRHAEYSVYHNMGMYNGGGFGVVNVVFHNIMGVAPYTIYYEYDEYIAFSPDKASMIKWEEKMNNLDGEVSLREYSIVPKEELLPKAVNYKFLNE